MRILIVEDEMPASERLRRMILELRPKAEIVGTTDSISDTLEWLAKHEAPDLAFFDIHLSDGSSLEILDQHTGDFPVIFTTAYDEYALDAFRAYSIDYLLKPLSSELLSEALDKLDRFQVLMAPGREELSRLREEIERGAGNFQQRFLIRLPEQIKAIDIDEVAYFYIESRITFMQLKSGKTYPSEFNLEQLEERTDPRRFFRVNRQFLVSYDSIDKMFTHTKSRVVLKLRPDSHLEAVVSSERSAEFKHWLQG